MNDELQGHSRDGLVPECHSADTLILSNHVTSRARKLWSIEGKSRNLALVQPELEQRPSDFFSWAFSLSIRHQILEDLIHLNYCVS